MFFTFCQITSGNKCAITEFSNLVRCEKRTSSSLHFMASTQFKNNFTTVCYMPVNIFLAFTKMWRSGKWAVCETDVSLPNQNICQCENHPGSLHLCPRDKQHKILVVLLAYNLKWGELKQIPQLTHLDVDNPGINCWGLGAVCYWITTKLLLTGKPNHQRSKWKEN